ncbi:STAS/SEC14 domain-containing protein [Photobacterium sp.]|uniref:STAS/SEC14 domain-containing protein n=1 Tax=Photobacterium sp. TaxID=660 RepID=UPI00299DCC36|nr:STAS/SEC14 domain-containing protein [Photobacterium sp.]MDX1302984.1 STAS/SEC14 domain-containing protein [Photobacterium sp.]
MADSHGLTMVVERDDDNFLMELKAKGKLTHADYEKITPEMDQVLEGISEPTVNIFFDGAEFEGWELQAAWDELKLTLKHGKKFSKIAVYGNKRWLDMMSHAGSWFISGEVKYFEEPMKGLAWLRE